MSITLETLILEYQADFSKLDSQLTQGVTKAKKIVAPLEHIVIKPTIDLSQLKSIQKQLSALAKINIKLDNLILRNQEIAAKAKQVGIDLSRGFSSGIASGGSDKAATELGKQNIKALRKSIKAQSPSLEAVEAGVDFARGFGLGIARTGQSVIDIVRNLGSGSLAGLVTSLRIDTGLSQVSDLFTTQLGRRITAALTGIGLVAFSGQIANIVSNLANFQKELDTVLMQLKAINDAPATNIFDKFGKQAERARMSVLNYAQAYSSMLTALRGKVVDPSQLFAELTAGLADRGVIGDAATRATLALQQMAAKGVVSMEELRRQLANALPGAFTLSAKAMGVSERQMIALVSSGQLLASDFLPKLAKELQVAGGNVTTFTSELVKTQNIIDGIKFEATQILPFKTGLQGINVALTGLREITKPLLLVILPGMILLVGNLIFQLASLAAKTKAAALASSFLQATLIPTALAVTAVATTLSAFESITVSSAKGARELNKEIQNLGKTGEEVKQIYKTGNILARFGEVIVNAKRSAGIGGLSRETASEREERVNRETITQEIPRLFQITQELKLRTDPGSLQKASDTLASDLEQIQDMAYKVARRESFDLTPKQAQAMQVQIQQLQDKVDNTIELQFKVSEANEVLKFVEAQRKLINEELAKGANKLKYQAALTELDLIERDARAARDRVQKILIDNKPIMQLDIDTAAMQQALSRELAIINTSIQLETLQSVSQENLSSRAADVRSTRTNERNRQAEEQLLKELNNSIRQFPIMLSNAQRDRLLDITGATNIEDISITGLEKAKKRLELEEREGGVTADKVLNTTIERLLSLAGNTQRLNEIGAERIQEEIKTTRAITELGIEIQDLNLNRLQKILDTRSLEQQLERSFTNNQTVFTNRLQASRQARQLQQSANQQQQAFDNLVRGIDNSNQQLRASLGNLVDRIKKTTTDIASASIKGIDTFMSAAGIEDLFGISKLRNLVTKSLGIATGDRRPQLRRQISREEIEFDRRTQDSIRQQIRLNSDIDNAILDLQDQLAEGQNQRQITIEDTEMSLDRLVLRISETQNAVNQMNRDITAANQTAQEFDMADRIAALDITLPSVADFEAAPEAVLAQLDAVFGQIAGVKQETIDFYRSIKTEGNREITAALDESRQIFTEKLGLLREELELEGTKIAQSYKQLLQELSGTVLAVQDNLVKKVSELTKRALDAREGVNELFKRAGFGVSREELLGGVMAKITNDVDSRILEFKQAQQGLERLLEAYEGEASADFISDLVNSEDIANVLDPSVRNRLVEELKRATESENYQELGNTIQSLISTYQTLTSELEGNKDAITEGVAAIASRKGIRKIEDAEIKLAREALSGRKFEMDSTITLAKIDIDEQAAKQSLERELQDMVGEFDTETIEAYRDLMLEINDIKFDRLRKEASELNKIMTSGMDALEGGLADAIAGIGNVFFDRADRENEILKQKAEYGEKIAALYEEHRDNPDLLDTELERLGRKNEEILDSMGREFGVFNQVIDLGRQALAGFAKALAEAAAKMTASAIISGVGKAIFGGGFANGGMVQNAANGAKVAALTAGIQQAMVREGNNAIPIVAQKGEQILSTKNGDAQFWRALRDNNMWDALKSGNVANFAGGGTVGGTMMNLVPVTNNNTGGNSTYNLIQNNTYNLPQTTGFNKSLSQIESARQAQMKRELERNG